MTLDYIDKDHIIAEVLNNVKKMAILLLINLFYRAT